MDKFGRNYSLTIFLQSGTLLINPPFTIEFDITRNQLRSANVGQVRVYNLGKMKRDLVRKNILATAQLEYIELRAGYGTNLPIIFRGDISQAWSVREQVNFITQIESFDGGFASINGTVDLNFAAGTPNMTVYGAIAQTLPNTTVGTIGAYPGVLPRGATYSGNSLDILSEISGGGAFIDNGKVNILGTYDIAANVNNGFIISPQSGLLNTPLLESTVVHFDMIFEPRLAVGQLVTINSFTEQNFNGKYKVTAVKHRGMISEAVCGTVITTGEFLNLNNVA